MDCCQRHPGRSSLLDSSGLPYIASRHLRAIGLGRPQFTLALNLTGLCPIIPLETLGRCPEQTREPVCHPTCISTIDAVS